MKGGVGDEVRDKVKNPMHYNTYTDKIYTGEPNMQTPAFVKFLYELIQYNTKTIGGSHTTAQSHINEIIDKMTVEELNKKDCNNNYLLIVAITFNNVATVKALLDKGVNPNVVHHTGKTALAIARENGNTEIVEMLEQSVANQKGNTEMLENGEAKGGKRNRTIKRKKINKRTT